jgi:hypothetical protein
MQLELLRKYPTAYSKTSGGRLNQDENKANTKTRGGRLKKMRPTFALFALVIL